ncbi:DMT family transporter [Caldimonas thermodepolymerans]|uniref:EamA family transporter n=1 Tax=Caldimonas thermodepolymerans TaxID=215580 RepID=A0A2S5T516_9BURK|nr:DMT family transporter [Caldimonas thermodepolymerans]PPE70042.1 EamA family transporter [Caldimonas thermodepolymerans]QPC31783.1 DMT family transporter [Caldimonas thermodepolymerans]RDI01712.1 threonine/homoserine efflux transporter RhtA [Caldimonas thermodepolymerans]UZG44567.1 DMT family transporter [Caldimonas thermodepolymerans]
MTDHRRPHLDSLAVALLVGCCLLWGLQQIVAKATLPLMPPVMQAALRSAVAALLVWAWAAARGIPMFQRDGTLPGGVIAGVLFALEFICIYVGLGYTAASRLVVLLYLSPFVVAAGMPFIARSERLAALQVGGLVLGFVGVAIAFSEGLSANGSDPRRWIGDALAVSAAVLWGATTLAIRATRLSTAAPEKTLFYQLAISALVLGPVSLLWGESWPAQWTAGLWGSMFFQSVIVAFISYLVWFWLIRHYPATRLASFTFLTPLLGLMMGWVILGETITPQLLVALACVAAGIWLVNRKQG